MANHTAIRPAHALLFLFTALTLRPAVAAQPPDFRLRPAEAHYRIVVNGIPLGLDARVRLEHDQGSNWQLRFLIASRLFQHREWSSFQWGDCHAHSQHYFFDSRGFGIHRGGTVDFDWKNSLAVTDTDAGSYPLKPDAVDSLAASQLARCQLAGGQRTLIYQVADPRGPKQFRYRVLGVEPIETPAGTFQAVHLERLYARGRRHTELWAAIKLGYFMVRMDHVENPLVHGRIELTDFRYLDPPRQAGKTTSNR